MYRNGYQYLDNDILTSDPLKLVRLLYQGALDAVEAARGHLRKGDIRERSRSITKGLTILHELTTSLDHSRGGEISCRLAALYDYIERLLITANTGQVEEPLVEAQKLLSKLLEAWEASMRTEASKASEHVEPHYRAHTMLVERA